MECHQGRQGFSSWGCLLVTKARGASSSEGGGGLPQPELSGEKHRGSDDDEDASRGERGTRVGTAPRVLALTPAGNTRAMSPFDSLVGTRRTPEPGPAVKKTLVRF